MQFYYEKNVCILINSLSLKSRLLGLFDNYFNYLTAVVRKLDAVDLINAFVARNQHSHKINV